MTRPTKIALAILGGLHIAAGFVLAVYVAAYVLAVAMVGH